MSIPGWYPDPHDPAKVRWWDGTAWSSHVEDAQPTAPSYPGALPAYTAEPLTAPADTRWNTPWVWLVIVLPTVPLIGLWFIDWAGAMDYSGMLTGSDPLGLSMYAWMFSPAYLLTMLAGWLSYGLSVLFAFFDWRTLRDRGVPKPFHWAWAFLYGAVYVIGRSVVFRNRTGNRSAMIPMWVQIATIVLEVVAVTAFMIYLFMMLSDGLFDMVVTLDRIESIRT